MSSYPNHSSIGTISHVLSRLRGGIHLIPAWYGMVFLLLGILPSMGCAILRPPSPETPFTPHDAEVITADMYDQGNKVSSFYTSGTVMMKDWKWESEADILIAGNRDPLKIKIEITHSWGKPILHILMEDHRLEILSFTEEKFYSGDLTSDALSVFFPGRHLDPSLIWAVLRGYPPLMAHENIEIPEMNTIRLTDRKGDVVEIIEIDPESRQPVRVDCPDQKLSLTFSGFKNHNGIDYAGEIKVKGLEGGKDLILQNRKMVFNRRIPDQIFHLEMIPGFETVFLKETRKRNRE
jgi:hypothetical protein